MSNSIRDPSPKLKEYTETMILTQMTYLCDIPVDFTAPINFHDLAKKVKNASTIEAIARKYFIHPDYEADPTLHIE